MWSREREEDIARAQAKDPGIAKHGANLGNDTKQVYFGFLPNGPVLVLLR
jgi:hypothetical protein